MFPANTKYSVKAIVNAISCCASAMHGIRIFVAAPGTQTRLAGRINPIWRSRPNNKHGTYVQSCEEHRRTNRTAFRLMDSKRLSILGSCGNLSHVMTLRKPRYQARPSEVTMTQQERGYAESARGVKRLTCIRRSRLNVVGSLWISGSFNHFGGCSTHRSLSRIASISAVSQQC